MKGYVDGFVFPIAKDRLDDYVSIANQVAEIYLEYGAVEYREFVGDDLDRDGTRSFPTTLESAPDETIVFGWIVFESRESRDCVNSMVEADRRIEALVAPLMEAKNPIFSPGRMAYGGFAPLFCKGQALDDAMSVQPE